MSTSVRQPEIGTFVTADGEPFGDWELPGMGEAAPRCGEVSAVSFCDSCTHIGYRKHACQRRECPECWSDQWAGPRTVSVVSRLAAARYATEETAGKRAVHAVVSPPEAPNSIESFYRHRTKANEIAKEHGIRGGVVVAHGYRPTEETKDAFEEEAPDRGLWWWIRENATPWRDQVVWSPHYHVIGLADPASVDPETGQPGHIVPGEDREDRWVFRSIRSLARYESPRDVDGLEDMIGVVRYLLSHATFPREQNRQAVTWFGDLHGSQFDPEEALSVGSWSVIQRLTEELVGHELQDDESADDLLQEEEPEECPRDGCDGTLHDIWGARAYLDTVGGSISEERRDRIRTAYEWVSGYIEPPPGLKHPQSEKHAREALEAIL